MLAKRENTLGRQAAQGISIRLRLFERFDFTGYNLARLECCQIAAFRRSKYFAVDDGLAAVSTVAFVKSAFGLEME